MKERTTNNYVIHKEKIILLCYHCGKAKSAFTDKKGSYIVCNKCLTKTKLNEEKQM